MARSVTIFLPEDEENLGTDFTAQGAVCPRLEPVELILDGGSPIVVNAVDGIWTYNFAGLSAGDHTLVARHQSATGVSHTVEFSVSQFVSTPRARKRSRPTTKKPSGNGQAKRKKRRTTV